MVRIVRSTAFWLSFAVVCTAVESSVVGAPLRGEIRRQVINPFGLASDLGWGLATDGNVIFASSIRDGEIHVLDPLTLATVDTIATSANSIAGLAYRDGLLYGIEYRDTLNARIFALDPISKMVQSQFDTPGSGVTSLSFGHDGLLYASDGFTNSGTYLYAFDAANGELERTVISSYIVDQGEKWYDIVFTDVIEWMPDNTLLLNHRIGDHRLSFTDASGETLTEIAPFDVPGLPSRDWRGSALNGNTLYLWGFRGGSTLQKEFYEIRLVPEPSAFVSLAALVATVLLVHVHRSNTWRNAGTQRGTWKRGTR